MSGFSDPLFEQIKRALHESELAAAGNPISRKRFLRSLATAAAGAAIVPAWASPFSEDGKKKRIAIIGAGLAGMTAAHWLAQTGAKVTVYEASARVGGRTWSRTELDGEAVLIDAGGEFVDAGHSNLLRLAESLNVPLSRMTPEKGDGPAHAYHFENRTYSSRDLPAALAPAIPVIAVEMDRFQAALKEEAYESLYDLDHEELDVFLQRMSIEPWLAAAISKALEIELASPAAELSALNFLSRLKPANKIEGEMAAYNLHFQGGWTYKIQGGAQRICLALAQTPGLNLRLLHTLRQIRAQNGRYRLEFEHHGKVVTNEADAVLLTVPANLLNEIPLDANLRPETRNFIEKARYGDAGKLFMQLTEAPWAEKKLSGYTLSDLPAGNGWQSARIVSGDDGGGEMVVYTVFCTGMEAQQLAYEEPQDMARRAAEALKTIYNPGNELFSGHFAQVSWGLDSFSRGAVGVFRKGDWSSLAAHIPLQEEGLFFAGDVYTLDSQGSMNGAVQSAQRAVSAMAESLKLRLPASLSFLQTS